MAVERVVPTGIGDFFPGALAGEAVRPGEASAGQRWAIVLAGGEGSRLQGLTRSADGMPVPKQFCTLCGRGSLLDATLRRAQRAVRGRRVMVVLSAAHRRWWEPEMARHPDAEAVVQPCGRGTAAGIVLPLTRILRRDPEAVVASFPSDHHVEREGVLAAALERAFGLAAATGQVLLLGVTPALPDPEFGWVLPAAGGGRTTLVRSFREKPPAGEAARLAAEGALVNSFMIVARGAALLRLCARALPGLTRSLLAWAREDGGEESLADLYERIPCRDFSREVLERAVGELAVLRVPPCGWSDLGTPERVASCLARLDRPADDRRGTAARRRRPRILAPIELLPDLSRRLTGSVLRG